MLEELRRAGALDLGDYMIFLVTENRDAPNIEGTTPNGDPISLNDFKGKLVMVDFFGDW